MNTLFVIDIECFSAQQTENIKAFREAHPEMRTIWTITGPDLPEGYPSAFGVQDHDRVYHKPDTESVLENALSKDGENILDHVDGIDISRSYVVGATFYGCVLGAVRDLREHGLNPSVITPLTDYQELYDYDHEEGEPDWLEENVREISVETAELELAQDARNAHLVKPHEI